MISGKHGLLYADGESAKRLMDRLNDLGIVVKIEVGADGRFHVTPADGKHRCQWPGCVREVPPAMWGCKGHWFTLPLHLRDKIIATYRRGQEVTRSPSGAYLEAAFEVQQWIAQFKRNMARIGSRVRESTKTLDVLLQLDPANARRTSVLLDDPRIREEGVSE